VVVVVAHRHGGWVEALIRGGKEIVKKQVQLDVDGLKKNIGPP
jgi:hypothetical protein